MQLSRGTAPPLRRGVISPKRFARFADCMGVARSQAIRELLQQAIEWNTAHFVLWLELGRCQQALGLVSLAKNSFAQAQELNPDCQARVALEQVSRIGLAARVRGLWRRLSSR